MLEIAAFFNRNDFLRSLLLRLAHPVHGKN
jgi:hypothetical protein